jgi:hypothetical protein
LTGLFCCGFLFLGFGVVDSFGLNELPDRVGMADFWDYEGLIYEMDIAAKAISSLNTFKGLLNIYETIDDRYVFR